MVKQALRDPPALAVRNGLPQLQTEAQAHIAHNTSCRYGQLPTHLVDDHVSFSISIQIDDRWATQLNMGKYEWGLLDYGDILHWGKVSTTLQNDLKSTWCGKNQCLIIHLAAGAIFRELVDT